MRGWPRTFPQPHIKAGRQLLSHKRLSAFQGPAAGGVSRGALQPTWPPPGRAHDHGGGACPLTTRGWELGRALWGHQASHPPLPSLCWKLAWFWGLSLILGLLPRTGTLPLPCLPRHRAALSHSPAGLTSPITRWHAALLPSPPFYLDTLTCPHPILPHHAGDKRETWWRQKAGHSLRLDLSFLI